MNRLRFIIILSFVLGSCMPKFSSLKGNYFTPPFSVISNNSKEVVWDKIIDLFAQKGLPIKIIDKSSGLIISEKTSFLTTTEKKTGELVNKKAWLVVPGRYDANKKSYYMKTIGGNLMGEWNVRIKEAAENKR